MMLQTPIPPGFQVFNPGPPVEAIVVVIMVLVGGVILYPLVRAYARRLERGSGPGPEIAGEVEQLRTRVADLEPLLARVEELEDRLDFTERVLAQKNQGALPRGDDR